tara:strand:- start:20 stop:412 length:393 start_codon:yes stop_codon:yes gene_type:complete
MPHLQFDINFKVENKTKQKFLKTVETIFCNIMETGRFHIAISLKELNNDSISLGRSKKNENICLMNLDIRKGRTQKQKRVLVVEYINLVNSTFGVKKENQYVTLTEHNGEDFNLSESCLDNWFKNDDPLN